MAWDDPLPWEVTRPGPDDVPEPAVAEDFGSPGLDEPEIPPAPAYDRESDEPAVLAAWYSGFAYAEHYRKVVLAECHEAVRAEYEMNKKPITEKRLENLARTHPAYLDFLARHLHGRIKWEREVRAQGGMT